MLFLSFILNFIIHIKGWAMASFKVYFEVTKHKKIFNKLPLANASGINRSELRSPSPKATQA